MTAPEPLPGTAPVLLSRVRMPPPRPGMVARPRLTERILGPDGVALTLVAAAAGFGKTTVVADALREHPAVAWLSLDERDDDPALFWTHVVAALRVVRPGLGSDALARLESPEPSIDAVVALLLNDLGTIPEDLVLVLDDYHLVGSPQIHESMAFLVSHLPPRVRVVLATRADPPLPLASLRAKGALREVRAADLRFTAQEAATYLGDAMGITLSQADVETLEARTEGWIAALQLAALSMRGRDDPGDFVAAFAGDDRFILDYLAEEVLERQTNAVRDFLLRTSILSRLTGPLCDALTGRDDGRATLEALERANLFIVPLDDRRTWYRYHHLFGDVLTAHLLDRRPELVADLHRRAGEWHASEGDLPEAVRHALAGDAPERAGGLIERAIPGMQRARREATVRRWFEALPDEVFAARPVLAVARIGALMATGTFDDVEALLRGVEGWLAAEAGAREGMVVDDHNAFRAIPAQVAMYRAALALIAGDADAAIGHAERTLALAEPDDHLRRGGASALIGLGHWARGSLREAGDRYAQAIASLRRAGNISDALGCSLALADIQTAQGRLGAAQRTLEGALRLADEHGAVRGTADMHVALAELLLERGDTDGADRQLGMSRELGEHAGLPQHAYRSRVAMARVLAARGDPPGALELLDEAERVFNSDFSPPVRPVAAVAARVRLAMGDVAGVLEWASERGLDAADVPTYLREFEHITLAWALVAGDPDSAAGLVERLLQAAEAGGRTGSVIELHVLDTVVHLERGDTEGAGAALAAALVAAAPEGQVRPFLDAGPRLAGPLRDAARRGPSSELARRILGHLRGGADGAGDAPADTGLREQLSGREREVLRLLGSDLSGPGIARELVVSLNTLRTHTKNIYAKLGVNDRRAAVRRAAELGL